MEAISPMGSTKGSAKKELMVPEVPRLSVHKPDSTLPVPHHVIPTSACDKNFIHAELSGEILDKETDRLRGMG
jgi:hypothetical protein